MNSNLPLGAARQLREIEDLDRLWDTAWEMVIGTPDPFNAQYHTEISTADWKVMVSENAVASSTLSHLQDVVYERLRNGE